MIIWGTNRIIKICIKVYNIVIITKLYLSIVTIIQNLLVKE